jgi:hypothetical protein
MSFAEFMQTRPDGGEVLLNERTGKPLAWADIFQAMGADPSKLLLNELASMNDDFRLIVSLVVTDCFIKGFSETATGQPPLWSDVCFSTGVATQFDEIRKTWFKFQGAPTLTAEGENFPEASISLGTEVVRLEKRGLTLRLTTEFARSNPLDIIESWLVELGRMYQYLENNRCVDTLINGDLAGGVNAAPVIGVLDPTVGLQYDDLLNCWMVGDEIGEQFFTMISGRTIGSKIGSLDEFKQRQLGKPSILVENHQPEPSVMSRFVSQQVPDNQLLLVDRSHAIRQRIFIPLRVDRAFKPENWTEGITIGYYTGFERVADKACVVIDESLALAEHDFPSWFTVGGVRP